MIRNYTLLLTLFLSLAASMGAQPQQLPQDAEALPSIPEVWRSADYRKEKAELDSMALWRSPDGADAWLFVTGKKSHTVEIIDGHTGRHLRTLGKKGSGQGEFRRPNGIAVADDLLFVVERGNRRLQVFRLPSLDPVLQFGEELLINPYGLTVFRDPQVTASAAYHVYITDQQEFDPKALHLAAVMQGAMAQRVKHLVVSENGTALTVEHRSTFGDIDGPGALFEVETIMADPEEKTLWICDEKSKAIRIYDLDGKFTGRSVGEGIIVGDPEGLALYRDASLPEGGVWVLSDQRDEVTVLRLFSRRSGHLLVSALGRSAAPGVDDPVLAMTDGLWLAQESLGTSFHQGALFCAHLDKQVSAYSFGDLLKLGEAPSAEE